MLEKKLHQLANKKEAENLSRFFKLGPGEYGEGDIFLGIRVPFLRTLAKEFRTISLTQCKGHLKSPYHEERLVALFILVDQFTRGDSLQREKIVELYLTHLRYVNNWDLVDQSADKILGAFLFDKDPSLLFELAKSPDLWERRVSIISTFYFIRQKSSLWTYKIAKKLLGDSHDLIHKATGWMLREAGKRVSKEELEEFLLKNSKKIHRTTLRYAIEHFPEKKRQQFLNA